MHQRPPLAPAMRSFLLLKDAYFQIKKVQNATRSQPLSLWGIQNFENTGGQAPLEPKKSGLPGLAFGKLLLKHVENFTQMLVFELEVAL